MTTSSRSLTFLWRMTIERPVTAQAVDGGMGESQRGRVLEWPLARLPPALALEAARLGSIQSAGGCVYRRYCLEC